MASAADFEPDELRADLTYGGSQSAGPPASLGSQRGRSARPAARRTGSIRTGATSQSALENRCREDSRRAFKELLSTTVVRPKPSALAASGERGLAIGLGMDLEWPPAGEVAIGRGDRHGQCQLAGIERRLSVAVGVPACQILAKPVDFRRVEKREIELPRRTRDQLARDTDADRHGRDVRKAGLFGGLEDVVRRKNRPERVSILRVQHDRHRRFRRRGH